MKPYSEDFSVARAVALLLLLRHLQTSIIYNENDGHARIVAVAEEDLSNPDSEFYSIVESVTKGTGPYDLPTLVLSIETILAKEELDEDLYALFPECLDTLAHLLSGRLNEPEMGKIELPSGYWIEFDIDKQYFVTNHPSSDAILAIMEVAPNQQEEENDPE